MRGHSNRPRRRIGALVAFAASLAVAAGTFATLLAVSADSDASGATSVPECQGSISGLAVDSDTAVYHAASGAFTVPGVTVGNIHASCQNAGLGLYLTASAADGTSLQSVGPLLITSSTAHFDLDAGAVSVEGLQTWVAAIHPIFASAPTNLQASAASASSVAFSWTAPATPPGYPVTDYVVEYSSDEGDSWTTFNDAVSTTSSTTITGLAQDTAYHLRVSAVNAAGTGPASTMQMVRTSVPGIPGNLAADAGPPASLTWTAPTSVPGAPVTDYVIAYSGNGGSSWTTYVDGVSTTPSASVEGLQAEVPYLFRVSAVNAVGQGSPATTTEPVTLAATAPGAVTGLSATPGVTVVDLSWSAPVGGGTRAAVTGYVVQSSTDQVSWTPQATVSSGTLTYQSDDLIPGTTYYFRVFATSSAGNGAIADPVSAVPIEPDPVPVPDGVTITTDQRVTATLTWTGANDMDLMTVGPSGESIWWNNTIADDGGYLEVDQIPDGTDEEPTPQTAAETHVENIYYDYDAWDGEYEFWLNRYAWPREGDSYFHPGYYTYTIRIDGVIAWQESGSLGTYWNDPDDVDVLLRACTPDFAADTCD